MLQNKKAPDFSEAIFTKFPFWNLVPNLRDIFLGFKKIILPLQIPYGRFFRLLQVLKLLVC